VITMTRTSTPRRLLAIGALTTVIVFAGASPAFADPAEPTNYRSQVIDVNPTSPYVEIQVTGGDSFLGIAVAPGHTAEIPGYFHEPYLRIDADGSVWGNVNSPAFYINESRFGTGGTPSNASADATPEWRQIASGGRWAWHDHRTHWMSPDLPPSVSGTRAEIVFPWDLPIVVDGVDTRVSGQLLWYPSTNPVGPIMLGLVGLAPLMFLRRRHLWPIAVAAAVAAVLALLVATSEYLATPAPGRTLPFAPLVPAIAVVASIVAIGWDRRPIRAWGASIVAGVALLVFTMRSLGTLAAPILPSSLPAALERTAVALTGWVGIVVIVLGAVGLWDLTRDPRRGRTVADGAPFE
jgi:hypothetical protein